MLNVSHGMNCNLKEGYLSLPKDLLLRINSFRKSQYVDPVKELIEREIGMTQDEYEALPADDEKRLYIDALRKVLDLLFDKDLTKEK